MAAPNVSTSATTVTNLLDLLAEREGVLWVAVVVTYLLDVALTAYGLSLGFEEANPVARATMVLFGPLPAMVALKTFVIGVAVVFTRIAPPMGRPLIPLAVATPWAIASLSNFLVIFGGY
ncbi:hypothetical protein C499_07915 [Halogeometricum borinquense DSM 11551]|uniref:DUF5658 domain-containing protein n=2 Tax=Halogeometricum borinquense TaxID=60847 RepID=E4NMU7_HALBP|nr:DUF5658 family protein [Halogeometricum borinquense]ADQ67359.1 hypothetical protein Hbor_17910 [Halogeometricum borinquense DSM 11551]ELY28572.1 hypothetical protein C499_07915 [Halogeometricum borinquense DSM 11551]RYJ13636.1 hypothetical protein ELS19_06470 [Halogeometricum borinquense]